VYKTEAEARAAADTNLEGLRAARMAEMTASGSMVTLSSLATFDEDSDTLQRMNLIIKGDTSGVVEAIKGALQVGGGEGRRGGGSLGDTMGCVRGGIYGCAGVGWGKGVSG
jgi:translation initiation factor IF-2